MPKMLNKKREGKPKESWESCHYALDTLSANDHFLFFRADCLLPKESVPALYK